MPERQGTAPTARRSRDIAVDMAGRKIASDPGRAKALTKIFNKGKMSK